MSASRLLAVLLILQQRGRVTAPALSRELEVSLRTVHRDLEALAQAGVPIVAHRGVRGGFELLDRWQTTLAGLDEAEARALPFLELPALAHALGVSRPRDAARLKLEAALSPAARDALTSSRDEFLFDDQVLGATPATLQFLATCIRRRREIRCGGLPAAVQPLALVASAGQWCLVFASGQSIATAKLAALDDFATTGSRFERPPGFDLRTWWATNRPTAAG